MKEIGVGWVFTRDKIVRMVAPIILGFGCILALMIFLCIINNDLSISTLVMAAKFAGILTGFVVNVALVRMWFMDRVGEK